MAIDYLLSKLERVKSTGRGRWIASCPTRDDKRPSMTIRELDDGRILLHDFGGSSPHEILNAIGMSFSDLYPESITNYAKAERRPFFATDVLKTIAFEALLIAMAASRIANGESFDEGDRARLMLAASRIREALHAAGVNP